MEFGGRAVSSVNSCKNDHKVSFAKRKMVVSLRGLGAKTS
jgi:hypothetical protein